MDWSHGNSNTNRSRRLQRLARCLAAAGLVGAVASAQTVVAGPSSTLTSTSGEWSWDGGSWVEPFRTALEDPQLFGATGVVETPNVTLNLTTVDAASLAGVDVFVSPWWADGDTPPDAADAVIDFFLAGGSLLLYQDDPGHDLIGERLGLPTMQVQADDTPVNGPPPIFDGAFGTASNVASFGTLGQLAQPDVNALNGTPIATNASGQIIAALWLPGQYAPGAGMLLVVCDVDTMAGTESEYAPLDDNGIFTLNAIHLLAFEGTGSVAVYGCGFNPPGSLTIKSGIPSLGSNLVLGLDNPFGTQSPGSLTYLFVSSAPHPAFPCGGALPGLGMAFPGQSGELLIDLLPPNPINVVLGDPWMGPGQSADVTLAIPFNPAFTQLELFGQGVIVDPTAAQGVYAGLTDAVSFTIGVGP